MQKGKYIVFEGPGFSGKSQVMKEAKKDLERRGFEVVTTREPGGCPEAEKIRRKLFRGKALGIFTPKEEGNLAYISREINMKEMVLPNMAKGIVVLKDRDYMSTFQYQTISGMSRDELVKMHNERYVKLGFPKPDLRLLLSINEESLKKRMGRGAEGDPFDDKALEAVKLYEAQALEIARGKGMFVKETMVVDANQRFEVVKNNCLRLIRERLGLKEDKDGKRRSVEY